MSEKIRVMFVEPLEKPKLITIDHTLETLQKLVGGYIQALYPWENEEEVAEVAVICNDEGKMNGSLPNRRIESEDWEDIIFGNFLITGLTADNFGSLSDELAEKYMAKFAYPEIFMRMGRHGMTCVKVGSREKPHAFE